MQNRLSLLLIGLLGLVFVSACTKSTQNQNVLAANKGGGDAEAAHGGDPLDLKLRSARSNLGTAATALEGAQRINILGQPLFSCNDFPVRSLCDAMTAPQNQRDLARQFILRNSSALKGLVSSTNVRLIPTKNTQSQENPDGSTRSVLAWTKLDNRGGADIYFNENAINLKDLELLALLAHEMGHVLYDAQYGGITDNQPIEGFASESGSGRYFLDLVAAEVTLYAYEFFLKSDPDSLNGSGKGFLAGREVMKHGGTFNQQADYIDFDGDGKMDLIYIGVDNEVYYSRFNGIKFELPQVIADFPGTFSPGHFFYPSLNGDRKGDILFRNDRQFTSCVSNGTAFIECKKVLDLPTPMEGGQLFFADFNGDQLTDIAFRDAQNTARIYVYDGAGYQPFATFTLPGAYTATHLAPAEIARDVDGIRRDDLMFEDATHTFYLYRATSTGFADPVWAMQHGQPGDAQYADFNGDGLSDLMFLGNDNRFWLNLSNGQNLAMVSAVADLGNDGYQSRRVMYRDLNADGRADILYHRVDGNLTTIEALYSKGTSFSTKIKAAQLNYATALDQIKVEDIDNDRRYDIMTQSADNLFSLWLSIEGR